LLNGISGVLTGGTNAEWWFRDGTDDASLIPKTSGGGQSIYDIVKNGGAVGNDTFDNTTIINNAVQSNSVIFVPDGIYYVRYLNNTKACDIQGPGQIVQHTTKTGNILLNDHANDYQRSFGQQNLSAYHNSINNGGKPAAAFFGDSRTTSIADTNSAPPKLVQQMEGVNGISATVGAKYNLGHPGWTTQQWRLTPDATYGTVLGSEIHFSKVHNVKVAVVWYGVNGPLISNTWSAANEAAQIEAAVRTIRVDSALTESKLSIVLMSPGTTTGDSVGHKGAVFYRPLAAMIAKIAEKYDCAYLDAAALVAQIPSSNENRTGDYVDVDGASDYMEKFFGSDKFYIHNFKTINVVVASALFDMLYPTYYKSGGSGASGTFYTPVTVYGGGTAANIDYGSFAWNRNISNGTYYNPAIPAHQASLLPGGLFFQSYATNDTASANNVNQLALLKDGRVGVNTNTVLPGYQFQVSGNSAFVGNVAGTGSASFNTGSFSTSVITTALGVNTYTLTPGFAFQVTGSSQFIGDVAGTGSASFNTGSFGTNLSAKLASVNTVNMLGGYQFQVTGNSAFVGGLAVTGAATFAAATFSSPISAPNHLNWRYDLTAAPTSTSTGSKGDVYFDGSYLYICFDTNQWARIPYDTTF
jgi:hypothetical protein